MNLVESTNVNNTASFKQALINPNALEGGLYSPLTLPFFEGEKYADLSYKDFALKLIESFGFGEEELFKKALKSYDNFYDKNSPIALQKIGEKTYLNELWHGPTRAFKDMALQPFGVLLKEFSKDKNILIICATSGDTGPATLKSFENMKNIKVVCMYPKYGTSRVQELQMRALDKGNLKVFAIDEDFDAAQNTLKQMLASKEFQEEIKTLNYELCAANSVNFGRILFQIIYHYYASLKLYKEFQEEVEIIIPSGNFGNALGAFYAKNMGAKISKIKIASNANNILSEFFNQGVYDLRGKILKKTISPAMDILISSNIERLLFAKFKDLRTKELMNLLKNQKYFKLEKEELQSLQEDFEADFCEDEECMQFIKQSKILIDPHTATCFKMLNKQKPTLITSTAEWTKFTPSMVKALYGRDCKDEKEDLKFIAKEFNAEVKEEILTLFDFTSKEEKVFKANMIKEEILTWMRK
ncbi:threonine synthase [Campylobacter sp. VicNov18]|uniref:threonine synthase n=1 Tax=Campylobacter bilis TaxID=2691918 RepID=UPI00130ECEA6|nr:threonine synthase [Campylobacter bilis]MPV63574.1 threonine synthase [Campylobacter hepaticus]MBM0637074.1 threonine synthase [Campylobacter bilis]MCC8277768.1 threonine synthase [Campylobacter bilis]MCC8299377.1 threonine synthase [Campylobacter bilis]MCC8300677.1 threonine synthase [Campylobacter bilis]